MNALEPKVARFFFVGDKLHSNHCIWCGNIQPLTDSHLFPEVIGGAFAPKVSCEACNSYLGRTFEASIKRNAFLTAAIAKLGLQSKREAFRFARKKDELTGADIHLTADGFAKPIPRPHGKNGFIGTPDDTKAFALRHFSKLRPNWSIGPLEEFYDDPGRTSLTRAGITFSKQTFEGGPGEIRLDGLMRDPDPRLIFKIVYEFITVLQLRGVPVIEEALKDLVTIHEERSDERISISSAVNWRTISNTSNCFHQYRQLEEVPFRPVHYVIFRLSRNLNLYIEVTFFNMVRSFFILGKLQRFEDLIMPLVDTAIVFYVGEPVPGHHHYRNLAEPIHVQWPDAAVDAQVYAVDLARQQRQP